MELREPMQKPPEETVLETDPINGYTKKKIAIPDLGFECIDEEFNGAKSVLNRYIQSTPMKWIHIGQRGKESGEEVGLNLHEDYLLTTVNAFPATTAYYTPDREISSIRVFCYTKIESKSTHKKIILREKDILIVDDSLGKKKSKSQIFPYGKKFKLIDNLFIVERNSGFVRINQEPPKQEPPVFASLSLVLPEQIALEHMQKASSPGKGWKSFFADTGIKAEIKH